ncbi:MAG TPA: META domain-containing protein [Microlunatus sp.]|nr:META domain-containing protein [Microlunatus sp.]
MANRTSLLRLTVLLLGVLALGAGCSPGTGQPDLNGTSWRLTSWAEPDPIPASATITAEFADDRVTGSAGINRYNAAVAAGSDGSFSIDQPVTTKMAGAEDATAAEMAYLKRLQAATSYQIDGDTLVIHDADGQSSLTFTRA